MRIPQKFASLATPTWSAARALSLALVFFCVSAMQPVSAQLFFVNSDVNISTFAGNETDPAVAANPNAPTNVFVAGVSDTTNGLFTAYTTNVTTWTSNIIASTGSTNLLPAYGEPSVAWDPNANLFLAYLPTNSQGVVEGIAVAVSFNGGQTFFPLSYLATNDVTDQPRITAGVEGTAAGSVWLTYKDDSLDPPSLVAQGLQTTNTSANVASPVPGSAAGAKVTDLIGTNSIALTNLVISNNVVAGTNVLTIVSNKLIIGTNTVGAITLSTNTLIVAQGGTNLSTNTFPTNAGFFTTITLKTNTATPFTNCITNYAIVTHAISTFSNQEAIPGSSAMAFPDIAIGPSNQVMVAYQNNEFSSSTSKVFVSVNTNTTLTNGFGPAITVTSDAVGGQTYIPAAETANGVSAGVSVAWDANPESLYYGRAYVGYASVGSGGIPAMNVCSRYSANNGTTWSSELQVNDDNDSNSHFLPRMSLDPSTGSLAFCWCDCRNDTGNMANVVVAIPMSSKPVLYFTNIFGLNQAANTDYLVYGTASLSGGTSFSVNAPMIPTNVYATANPGSAVFCSDTAMANSANGVGRHIGLAYTAGNIYPVWPDNSDYLGNNASPPGSFDFYMGYSQLPTANLGISVTVFPTNPISDESLTYYLVVTNLGPFAATNIMITNAFSNSVNFVGVQQLAAGERWTEGNNGQTIIFSFYPPTLSLAANSSFTNVINFTAAQSGIATNIASLGASIPNPNPVHVAATNVVTIGAEDLALSMSASPSNVDIGNLVTYTLIVTNLGPATNGYVYITNVISSDLSQITNVIQSQGTYTISNNTIVFSLGTMALNQITTNYFSATALSLGTKYQYATNTAFVTSSDFDTNLLNNYATNVVTILGEDVGVGLTAFPTNVNIGDTITYTLNITNFGASINGDIVFTNTLTDNVTNLTIQSYTSYAATGTVTQNANIIAFNIDELGDDGVFTMVYTAVARSVSSTDTNVLSFVSVSSTDFDTNLVNNTTAALVTINGEDLAVGLSASPTNPAIGSTMTFTLAVTNLGPSTTGIITLTNSISTNLTQITNVSQPQGTYTIDNNNNFVFELGVLGFDQSTNITFTAVVTSSGDTATNTVSLAGVYSTDFDQNLTNNTASLTIPISGEDLVIGLSGSPATVEFGQPITYTEIVTNLGPATNGVAIVTNTLSTNLDNITIVQSPGSYTTNGQTIVFDVGSLDTNQTATIIFTATPTSVGVATNTAVVNSFLINPAQVVTTTIFPAPPITNFHVFAFASSAFLTWNTPVPARDQVAYGLTTNYGNITTLSGCCTNHVVMLTGLTRNTTNYFSAMSWENGILYETNGSFFTANSVILKTGDAFYAGTWMQGTASLPGIYGSYFNVADATQGDQTASATYTPPIPTPGLYSVYTWYPSNITFSTNTQMYVSGVTNTIITSVNQTTNGGSWLLLAPNLSFVAGTGNGTNDNTIIYNNTGEANKLVAANAMMWSYDSNQDYTAGAIPAWWSTWWSNYLGTNIAATTSNYDDYVFGLPPNSTNTLKFRITFPTSNSVMACFSPVQGGRTYQLQISTNMANSQSWSNLTLTPPIISTNPFDIYSDGTGDGMFCTNFPNTTQTFFRLAVGLSTNY